MDSAIVSSYLADPVLRACFPSSSGAMEGMSIEATVPFYGGWSARRVGLIRLYLGLYLAPHRINRSVCGHQETTAAKISMAKHAGCTDRSCARAVAVPSCVFYS